MILFEKYLSIDDDNDDTTSFSCPSMKISVKHFYNSNLYFHRLKLTALIDKNKISNVNCNSQSRKCPISYYCDLNTEQCKKCLGKFSKCQDNDLICGRFTKEWETGQQTCNADYYNLQYLDEMTYDINPPIKSSAASLTFWLFTTKVIDDNDPKIYHFYNIVNSFTLIKLHLNSGIFLVSFYALIKIPELCGCRLITLKHLNIFF